MMTTNSLTELKEIINSNANENILGEESPNKRTQPRPDLASAKRYVEVLHGTGPVALTFLALKEDGKSGFPKEIHGTLAGLWPYLEELNLQGYAIFSLVQKGDGGGRKSENIIGLNALFTDDDSNNKNASLSLSPSIKVKSKRGEHCYWVLMPGEPLDRLTSAQTTLAAHFNTDPAVKDLTRVMRLPGTLHWKDPNNPFLVELIEANDKKYTIDEVLKAYPGTTPTPANDNACQKNPVINPDESAKTSAWSEWRSKALALLDLDKVYGEWLTGGSSGDGWLICRDPNSPSGDQHPSAGVADTTSSVERGSFHSFRTGETKSVFDFLIDRGITKDFDSSLGWVSELVGLPMPQRNGSATKVKGARSWKEYKQNSAIVQDCIPILDKDFVLFREANGDQRSFLVTENNEAIFLQNESPLRQKLHDGLKQLSDDVPPTWVLDRALEVWPLEGRKIFKEPQAFAFKGDDGLCFKRFDWEPEEGQHQAWDEFLDRLSDPEAFKAFYWSCFELENRSRQYLWLRGDGQDGKSVVLGVLADIFGNSAASISNSDIRSDSRFLTSSFYGKRILLYPDCKNTKFGMTELVRSCTSGDMVKIEFKNKSPFSVVMRMKLLVASNSKPALTGQRADSSRVICIEVSPTKNNDDPSWEQRLKRELPHFLWSCKQSYKVLCPNGGDITVSEKTKALVLDAIASFEESFLDVFEKHFCFEKDVTLKAKVVADILKAEGLSTNDISSYKTWLLQSKGITYKNLHDGRYYIDIALKDNSNSSTRR